MDASPDILAETVRAKRVAIDNDLELLRLKIAGVDPRRRIDGGRATAAALPLVAVTAAFGLWMWRRRRMRRSNSCSFIS